MSLNYAILGLLNVFPMSGYDLKHQAFDATVRHFWPADQSQIYRSLSQLQKGGFTVTIEKQSDRPDRKVYALTKAGKAALNDWLKTDLSPPTLRDPLLVQLFFGQETDRDELLRLITAQQAQHTQKLRVLEEIPIPPADSRPADRWLALQHLTLDFGLQFERLYQDWLHHCREVIEGLPDPDEVEDFRRRFE